jgi:hypothetical protein
MKVEEMKIETTIHIAQAKLTSDYTSQSCQQGALHGTQEMNITNLYYSSDHQLFKAPYRNAQQTNQHTYEIELALLIWEGGGGWVRDDERQHNG